MKKLTPERCAELARAPLPIVRVHGRTTSMAGASVRRRGAKPQSAAAKYLKHNRPRPAEGEQS